MYMEKGICLFLFILTALAVIKTIFISLDIDESYALAVGYRLATGEKLFLDLWESHQMGGIVLAPFLWLYLKIAGNTTYIVIYARVIGSLIHAVIGLACYKTAVQKGGFSKFFSLFLFFLHMNFLPKWVQCPEFELQQYWFALLSFLCFYCYYQGGCKKRVYLLAAGVMLIGQMFSYPTLILVYPVYILGIFQCGRKKLWPDSREETAVALKTWMEVLWFTAGAAVTGILFLMYLGSYLRPEELLQNIGYIFQDESHTMVSTAVKWKLYGEQFREILWSVVCMFAASMATGIILVRLRKEKFDTRKERWNESVFLAASSLILLSGLFQAVGGLFGNENQFYMVWRFFAISLMGILLALAVPDRKNGWCLWFGILPGFMTLLSVLVITNMNVNVSMAKMYTGVIATAWILGSRYETGTDSVRGRIPVSESGYPGTVTKRERYFLRVGVLIFLVGLFVCKLVQIRISGCTEATILAPLKRIEAGPAKGIYMLEDTAVVLMDDYRLLAEQLLPEDKLLYIGSENIIYLWTKAQVATPSTQGTNAYNEMYLRYYEKYPKKIPTVIAVDKELGENPAYYNSPQNHIIYEWMEKMGYREILDASHMKLYRISAL